MMTWYRQECCLERACAAWDSQIELDRWALACYALAQLGLSTKSNMLGGDNHVCGKTG